MQYRVASPYDLEHIPPPPSPPHVTDWGKIKRKPLFVGLVVFALFLVFPLCSQYNYNQATATAAQSTSVAQQQAVQGANQQLANDLSSLQQEINTLAQFSESNTLQEYAKDWKQMQDDYATEQQQAQQGCGLSNSNQNQVQADANQVVADYNQIMADDNQFNADKTQYNLETTATQTAAQTDMQNVQNDWTQLQQVVDNNPSGTPGAAYTASDVQYAINQGNKAVSTSQGAWENAQVSVSQYDQEASALQKKADTLPGSMNCS
jgi:hypothetical protein